MIALKLKVLRGKGIYSNKKIADDCRIWVKTSIQKRSYPWNIIFLCSLKISLDILPLWLTDFTWGQRKISKVFLLAEERRIKLRSRIVNNWPRENVILRQIIKTSANKIVKSHQVLKIRYLSILPHLHSLFGLLRYFSSV